MKARETFYFNYKPFLIGLIVYLIVFGYLLLQMTSMIPALLIIGFGVFVTYAVVNQVKFFKITISEDEVIAKPWFSEEKKLLNVSDLKEIHIEKSDSLAFASLIVKKPENDTNKRFTFNLNAYRLFGDGNADNKTAFEEKLKSLVEKDKLTIHEQDSITNTDTGKAVRWFVWSGVIVYAVKLYADMAILQGIHFSTMKMLPYTIGLMLVVGILCFVNIKSRTKKNDYLTSLLVGIALGWVLSSGLSTYIKWENENNASIQAKDYQFVLDDFDKERNGQRWLVSKEAQSLIERYRLYLDGRGQAYEINTQLAEDKTYSIPVAIGKFNDVFLPKDAFKKAKLVNEN